MQLKTSFFNRTLFKKNLTRYWPLWGLVSFIGAIFPLALLVNLLHGADRGMEALEMREIYYNVLVYGVPIISIIYAILCALVVWNYLYNARSIGMMHTLPVRRDGLFITNVLSGMVMMAIPYVITGALVVLVSLAAGGFDPWGTLVTIGGVICDSFFFFGLATFCAVVVGNVVALPLLYGLLNFIAVLTDATLHVMANGFIFGVDSFYSGQVEWLSPVVYLMTRVRADCVYEEVKKVEEVMGNQQAYYPSELMDVTLKNGHLLVVYGLVGIALLVLAFFLYRCRRSETAGDVVSFRALKPVFRYGAAFYAAVLGGRVLYALFEEAYSDSNTLKIIPMTICMFVAGAIGYYAATMLLAKSARVFNKRSTLGLAAVALACVVLCVGMGKDLLGISRRVPAADQIDTLEFYAAANTYNLDGEKDAELIEAIRQTHQAIVDQQDYAKTALDNYVWTGNSENYTQARVCMTYIYILKSGIRVERSYDLLLSGERMRNDPDSYDYALDKLVNGTAMRQRRIHATDGAAVNGGWFCRPEGDSYDLNRQEAQLVLNALTQDAAEGTWGTYRWFTQDDMKAYSMDLELYFILNEGKENRHSDSIYITIWPDMKHTIAALMDLNLIGAEDLVTDEAHEAYGQANGVHTYEAAESVSEAEPDLLYA